MSSVIHWLLILGSLVLLASGWVMRHGGLAEPDRDSWVASHVSLGLSCAVLIVLRALLWTIRGPVHALDARSQRRKRVADAANFLLYLSLVVVIVSGFLEAAAGGRPLSYWGIQLPGWDAAPIITAQHLGDIHRTGAFVAGGLIFLAVTLSGWARLGRRAIAPEQPAPATRGDESVGRDEPQEKVAAIPELRAPAVEVPIVVEVHETALEETQNRVVTKTANKLARDLRLFGWIDFWLQFVLGLIIALLLVFASSGKAFSPSRPGFGDAIYWGYAGFTLLIPAIVLAFFYVRASRKVAHVPLDYLHHEKRIAFWFLWSGLVIGGLGILISFVGVAMSIALLVVKTISQPPGIAITDPNNIIRALDVFVLIVNFMLLIAHFVGVGIALWLGFSAAKARVGYMSLHARAE